jgi:hypothetical protein
MESPRKQLTILISSLGAANFFAALGGGTVLGKAIGVLRDEPLLKGDSLVAMVGGTALGFLVLREVKKWKGRHRAAIFALATGLLSLVLWALLRRASSDTDLPEPESSQLTGLFAWLFFLVLTFRWACWYVGRSLRAETAGFHFQRIPIVELLYF